MTRFEQIGVNKQYCAHNIDEANNNFSDSCTRCSTSGRHRDCDRCSITLAHEFMLIFLNTKQHKINIH
jgi:hypothetical protein